MAEETAPVAQQLPTSARRLLGGTAALAAVLAASALVTGMPLSVGRVLVLAVCITVGELLRIDLPHRGGGTASFGLGDAALTAGLLLLGPDEVVVGAIGGVMLLQAIERVRPVKFVMNVAQYTAGAAAAALAVHAMTPRPGGVGPAEAGAVALGILLFLIVNAVTVAGMIALTSGRDLTMILRALLPTGSLLALGNTALAVIAVLLAATTPWSLPGLVVPVALLWYASRQAVRAQVDRERTAAFVEVEHALGAATTLDEVAEVMARAATSVLGYRGMVWVEDRWAAGAPPDSGRCPVDSSLAPALVAPGATLGLPSAGESVAIGLGTGLVLVATAGELPLADDAVEWIERLARSGRVHAARAAAAAELAQERATLGAVVDGTGDGVVLLRPDGTVAVWNPAMARLSGIPTAEAVGQEISRLLGPGPWQEEGVHDVTPQQTDAVWRVAVAGVEDGLEDLAVQAAGRPCVVAVHDVTAERRAARARDDILDIVSHELRTPLTPIIASAQMLRRRSDRLDGTRRDALLGMIEDRAQHLSRLVDDLLLVGQLSADGQAVPGLSAVPVDVEGLVADAITATGLSHGDHHLRFTVEDGCDVTTDPVRLRQVLDNLLDNACRYSDPGSSVTVTVTPDGGRTGEVAFRIADHGRGIPPAEVERVFDQFVRVEDPLVMTTSGAGLGLFIVRQLVTALGGRVELSSTVDVGTTVTVWLPRATATTAADDRGAAHDAQHAGSRAPGAAVR